MDNLVKFSLVLFVLVHFLPRCKDQDYVAPEPCDASRLSGLWMGTGSPFWVYDFNAPELRQQVTVAGVVVADQSYVFGTRNDSLIAWGQGGKRVWRVCFLNDKLAEVVDVSGVLVMPPFYLKKAR